jgi:hypothetical protein
VTEKNFVVPLKDLFDIALIAYLVCFQTKRNQRLNGSGKYKLQRVDKGAYGFHQIFGVAK